MTSPALLGRRPDPPDPRDHPLERYLAAPAPLPATYVGAKPKVLDQGQTPHCVGFSGAAVRAVEERRDEKRTLTFDGDDLYALAKLIDGYPGDGTDIRSAAKQCQKVGALVKTSPVVAEVGLRRPIAAYARLSNFTDVKSAIRAYGAAWCGSSWYDSWFHPRADGTLPQPDAMAGGHAYALLGWSDKRGAFHAQNSWGTSWGVGGRFWLPYAYVDFNDFDIWQTIDVLGDK